MAAFLLTFGVKVRTSPHNREGEGNAPPLGSGGMFDAVAQHYDRMNKFMSLGLDQSWRRFLIEEMQLREGDQVLDLATGTADVAILAGEAFVGQGGGEENRSSVWGIDPSAGMLAIGREKVAAKGLEGVVRLTQGDAQTLEDVPTGSIDKISMSFGIRNVFDRSAALRQMARVLKKQESSMVAILEFQLPRSGPLRWGAEFMIRYGAPFIGALLTGLSDEYIHLKRSILNFPTPEAFADLMREAGLEVVDVKETGFGAVSLFLARPSQGLIEEAQAQAAARDAEAAAAEEGTDPNVF